MKKNIIHLCLLILLFAATTSCKKKGEEPPVKSPGPSVTIADLKAIASCSNNCNKVFTTDTYLSGVVLADDVTGNFYKETYLRDATGAIHLTFKAAAVIFIGDSVRVNLKGLAVGYNPSTSMLEVDSLTTDQALVRLGSGVYPQPRLLDMNKVYDLNYPGYFAGFLNDLVVINGIGFSPIDTNKLYVQINSTAQSRMLYSCAGDPITLRTNSYATFATQKTPGKYGSIIGIATNYGSTKQLVIRNTTEWSMTSGACVTPGLYIKKNFNDNSITSGGWNMQNVTGTINWAVSSLGSWIDRPYAQITNYPSNATCETWLISPQINLSGSTSPFLSFQNAKNQYTGNATLKVMISTNYTSGPPTSATWTALTYSQSPGASTYPYVPSGNISLSAYKTAGVTIAFVYNATGTSCPTIEIDDISVIEN